MKIFFDFEFTGLHQKTTPISAGFVAENKRTFYAEFTDYDQAQVNEWIEENVIAHLRYTKLSSGRDGLLMRGATTMAKGFRWTVADRLREWLEEFNEPIEMWGDVLAYDWVLFLDLWGHSLGVPSCVYYIPFDIATLFKIRGVDPDVNREEFSGLALLAGPDDKHNALWDARVTKACYERLVK